MKSLIFRALPLCVCAALFLVLTSCGHDDDPAPYEPIPWGGAKEVVLAIDGVTVDSAFCANSSVYCEEDGKTVAVNLCNGDSVSFLLPSPNACDKCMRLVSENDKEAVYSRSYTSVVNLQGVSLLFVSHFTLDALKGYFSSDWVLDEIEFKGKRYQPLRKESSCSGYVFHLRKTSSGYEMIGD